MPQSIQSDQVADSRIRLNTMTSLNSNIKKFSLLSKANKFKRNSLLVERHNRHITLCTPLLSSPLLSSPLLSSPLLSSPLLSSPLLSSPRHICLPLCYKWPHVGNERIVISNLIMLHDSIKTKLLYQTPTISRDNLITKCQTATPHLGVIFIHAKVICFSIMN